MTYRRKLSYSELSAVNRASVILASSLTLTKVFGDFVAEIKKTIDIIWAAVVLIENDQLRFLAVSSENDSLWKENDQMPVNGSATAWVQQHKKPLIESGISLESPFLTSARYRSQGIRSVANFPLISKDIVVGSFIVAGYQPDLFGPKQAVFLKRITDQMTMPVVNSQLYMNAKDQARIDDLTGLYNRRYFNENLAGEINRGTRHGGTFSLIILDIDAFKTFNDDYGHLVGDTVLKQTANTIKNSIRSIDQAFRFGGDEFAVILPNTLTNDAHVVAKRVQTQIASTVHSTGKQISVSLGLATWPIGGTKAEEIINAADTALHRAKMDCSLNLPITPKLPR